MSTRKNLFPTVLGAALVLSCLCSAQTHRHKKMVTDRWYSWHLNGEPSGYFHVVQRLSHDPSAPVAFTHDFVANWRGDTITLSMQTFCKNDPYFTPVEIISEGHGDDEFKSFIATIDPRVPYGCSDGKLSTTIDGTEFEMPIPEHTVTDFVLFEIVPRLPWKEGTVFEFHSLEASELNLKEDQTISYLGEKPVNITGRNVKLHKFEHRAQERVVARYWVNEKHELVRILIDDRKEFLLTSKHKAENAFK